MRTIHWPKLIASARPLRIIPADHRLLLLTVFAICAAVVLVVGGILFRKRDA